MPPRKWDPVGAITLTQQMDGSNGGVDQHGLVLLCSTGNTVKLLGYWDCLYKHSVQFPCFLSHPIFFSCFFNLDMEQWKFYSIHCFWICDCKFFHPLSLVCSIDFCCYFEFWGLVRKHAPCPFFFSFAWHLDWFFWIFLWVFSELFFFWV